MSKRSLVRLILVVAICAICGFFFLPTKKIKLGLDLRGGVHFQLEVQGHEALEADQRDTRDRLSQRLQEKGFPSAQVKIEGPLLKVEGILPDQKPTAEKTIEGLLGSTYALAWEKDTALLSQSASFQKQLKDDANKRALQIIDNRINAYGVTEPEVTQTGEEGNRITVELPGVSEAERERIKDLLSTPGRLELRLLAKGVSEAGFSTREEAVAALGGTVPPDLEVFYEPTTEHNQRQALGRRAIRDTHTPQPKRVKPGEAKPFRWFVVQTRVEVDGGDIIDAHRAVDPTTNASEINFTLNGRGTQAFYDLTGRMVDESRRMAILLDRRVVMALGTQGKIPGGSVRITGSFTAEEADDFAMTLKSGSMRASMKVREEKSVGPGLGADSIFKGVLASALGFLTIIIGMAVWYRWSGINAIVALTVNTIVMLGLLGSLHAVLTLPGIAGFALTLGMAVDANILIYERIREELKNGKSVTAAIQAGFDRVFWTIVDSHVTQLAAALLLYSFGTSSVRGFAVTLTIGVVASLFTSIYISRFIYDWVLERHPGAKTISIGHYSIFANTKFPFMSFKGTALAISWGIILACIVAAQPWKGKDMRVNVGMQFLGGTDLMVRFQGDVKQDAVRKALADAGLVNAAVVAYEDKPGFSDFSIKQKAEKGQDAKQADVQLLRIIDALKVLDPNAKDPRPDLNTASLGDLAKRWASANPLGAPGDPESLAKVYVPWTTKIESVKSTSSLPYTSFDQLPKDLPAQLREDVTKNYRLGPMVMLKNESFSPSASGEWTQKTLKAVAWALGAILVYVFFRFTMSFAVGGIVALVHDILMALGIYALFGFEFSVPVVASFLILIGYSMADTIVVFDRIRENSHKPEYRRVPIAKLVDDSINQTLSRTILTSCSVLFVALCLFIFGGPALRDLSFPLVIGVITGTYSSIYIASPVVVYWDKWFGGKDKLKQH